MRGADPKEDLLPIQWDLSLLIIQVDVSRYYDDDRIDTTEDTTEDDGLTMLMEGLLVTLCTRPRLKTSAQY